jgi:hypothetical protein
MMGSGVRMHARRGLVGPGALLLGLAASAVGIAAQIPDEFTNLQHFPADIERDDLVDAMRTISLSLGVRCQGCHVGSADGVSFEGVDFASDESPRKVAAREMLAMVDRINASVAELPDRGRAREVVTCKTCHRGAVRPQLLHQFLAERLERAGPASLEEAYAEARAQVESGRFDFDEWEINLWGEQLADEGRADDAIAVFEVNRTHHPGSLAILSNLAPLYEQVGRTNDAIAAYEAIVAAQPGNAQARARLDALRGREAPGGA